MVKTVERFVASDGKEFATFDEAANHENKEEVKAQQAYEKYIQNTYNGQHLLKKHRLSETGTWKVSGEDPNCDFGGHHQPFIGYFEGKLEKVIRHVVMLPKFWTWGGGGSIKLEKPPQVVRI